MDSIPRIDISALASEDLTARLALAQQIGTACRDTGFFAITGHGHVTLLATDGVAGVQVRRRDGQRLDIRPMLINNTQWLLQVLKSHGQAEGKTLDCFGTSFSPEDFVYFTVFPDHLRIHMHRICPGVASFYFRFVLRVEADRVAVQRILDNVEGSNKKIRKELGEQYAKTSIGVPFAELDEDEEGWVEIALAAFQKCWPA